jgi:hypothetical protein
MSGAHSDHRTGGHEAASLVLVIVLRWRGRATLPGVHPLAVGHPPGSGLGPVGEGGAPCCLTNLRLRGQGC